MTRPAGWASSAAAAGLLLLLPAAAAGQAQNADQTGTGSVLSAVREIGQSLDEQLNGPVGRMGKGAIGYAGLAAALMAARDAMTFEGGIAGDGTPTSGGGSIDATSATTSTGTTATTATN